MRNSLALLIILLFSISVLAQENSQPIGDSLSGGRVLINSVDAADLSDGRLGLLFTILDDENNVVTDVPIMNLRMRFDDGVPYQGRVSVPDAPQHLTFLVNTSRGMRKNLGDIFNAIRASRAKFPEIKRENITIMGFDSTIHATRAISVSDRLDELIKIADEDADNSSACVYDALTQAIAELQKRDDVERRAVVLITNDSGQGKNCKSSQLRAVYNLEKITSLYILPLDGLDKSIEAALEQQSDVSGGIVYRIDSVNDFENAFYQVFSIFAQQRIAYADVCLPEGINKVELELELADLNRKLVLATDTFDFWVDESCSESEPIEVKINDLNPVLDTDTNLLTVHPVVENESLIGRYVFILRNVEKKKEWQIDSLDSELGEEIQLDYSSVPEGNYQLFVRAFSQDGELLTYYQQEGYVLSVSAPPTPSDTATATNTATSTNTATATDTATNTATSTNTATATATDTATNTASPTKLSDAPIVTESVVPTELTNEATEEAVIAPVNTDTAVTEVPTEPPPLGDGTPSDDDTTQILAILSIALVGIVAAGASFWFFFVRGQDNVTSQSSSSQDPLPMVSVSTEAHTFRVNTNVPSPPPSQPTPVHTRYEAYQEAQIVVVQCKGIEEGTSFPIYRSKSFVIGRQDPSLTDVELNLSCSLDTVSRLHCEILYNNEQGAYIIKHIGESTFTYIDDKHIGHDETMVLHSGSIIRNVQQKRIDTGEVQEWLELRFENLFDTSSFADKSEESVAETDDIEDKEKTVELQAVDDTEKNSPTPKIGLPLQLKHGNPETAISESPDDENPTEAIPKTDEFEPPDDEDTSS